MADAPSCRTNARRLCSSDDSGSRFDERSSAKGHKNTLWARQTLRSAMGPRSGSRVRFEIASATQNWHDMKNGREHCSSSTGDGATEEQFPLPPDCRLFASFGVREPLKEPEPYWERHEVIVHGARLLHRQRDHYARLQAYGLTMPDTPRDLRPMSALTRQSRRYSMTGSPALSRLGPESMKATTEGMPESCRTAQWHGEASHLTAGAMCSAVESAPRGRGFPSGDPRNWRKARNFAPEDRLKCAIPPTNGNHLKKAVLAFALVAVLGTPSFAQSVGEKTPRHRTQD
jgi:hypothetical protein